MLNQYGEEMEVENKVFTAVVKKGNFPMTAEAKGNTLTISEKLVAGDVLTITVQDKDKDGKVVAEGTTTITVGEYAKEVATKVSKITVAEDSKETFKDLKAGDEFTLEAEVLDQNNNVISGEQAKVRWVSSDKDVVAIKSGENFIDGVKAEFTAKKEGKATITAFTADGKASETFEVTVGQGKLATIDASKAATAVTNKDSVTVYVNEAPKTEEAKTAKVVTFQNENKNNIPVKAADINVDVTTAVKDFDAKDVKVEKVSDKDGNLVAFKITSNRTAQTEEEKKGTYTDGVKYNVKLSTADEKVAAANFDVTSKIDSKVTAIETKAAVEYRKGANPTEAITFKNAKGEVINVTANQVKFLDEQKGITLQATDKDGKFVEAAKETDVVTGLKYELVKDTKVVVAVGTTTQAIDVKVTGAAELKTISLGGNITKGVIAGEADFIQPITLKDQDGNAFIPTNLNDYEVAYSDSKEYTEAFKLAYYNTDKDGKLAVDPAVTADKAEGVALVAKTATNGALAGLDKDTTFTGVQVTAGEGDNVVKSNKISIKVGAVATLTTVDASASATEVTVGGTTTLTVVPKDQYGNVVEGLDNSITVTAGEGEGAIQLAPTVNFSEKKDDEGNLVGYTTDLTAKAVGTANLTVAITDSNVKVKPVVINVKEASDAIQSLEIEEVKTVNNSEDGAEAELKAIAKDAAGKEVAVAAKDLVWSVTKVIDEAGKEVALTPSVVGGTKTYTGEDSNGKEVAVTIDATGKLTASEGITVKVTAKVESHNDTEATVDVQFDKTPAKFVSGLTAKDAEGKELDLTKPLEIDTKGLDITFTGTDQYGDDKFEIPTNLATILVAQGTVAEATAGEEGTVKITAAAGAQPEAKTTVTVKYGGETVKLDVVVKETP